MSVAHPVFVVWLTAAATAFLATAPATPAPAPEPERAAPAEREWSQWRGPHRDGVSEERGLQRQWTTGEPRVLWRLPVGEGYSSISVWNDRLYTLWDEGESEYLVSLDAATGKEFWRHRVDAGFTSSWGNGPRSTPAVDSGTVFAVSARGTLHAVSARDGKAIWSRDLAAEYGGTVPVYGYSSSPMVEGDKLLVEAGGRNNFAFIAFDKSTGEVVWASQSDAAAYSSPLAITVDGVRQVVFFSASGLFALAPDDGRLLWKHPRDSSCPATGIPTNVAHPIFIPPDRIFVSNGYGTITGSAVLRIARQGEEFTVETLWQSETMRSLLNSSVLVDDHIYGFDVGIFKAIDAATGEEKWKARGFERGSLIAADGLLIVLGETGKLALVEATPGAYRERGSLQIFEGRSWTMPTLADGRLFLRNASEMVSLDLRGADRP